MGDKGYVLGLIGDPNREAHKSQLVRAALDGATKAGAPAAAGDVLESLKEITRF